MTTYAEWFKNARRTFLMHALTEAKGNQCVAAEAIGVHRNTLARMMKADGIPAPEVIEIRNAQPFTRSSTHHSNFTQHIYKTKASEHNGTYNPTRNRPDPSGSATRN